MKVEIGIAPYGDATDRRLVYTRFASNALEFVALNNERIAEVVIHAGRDTRRLLLTTDDFINIEALLKRRQTS